MREDVLVKGKATKVWPNGEVDVELYGGTSIVTVAGDDVLVVSALFEHRSDCALFDGPAERGRPCNCGKGVADIS